MDTLKHIAKNLEAYDLKVYACGGTVRDLLLKKTPYGLDFVVSATMEVLQKKLKNIIISINPYNTSITIRLGKNIVNLYPLKKVTLNNTYYSQTFTDSLLEDSNSRDFTVNAMYYDVQKDAVIDFHDGQKDLKNKIIRFVGDGNERIMESKIRLIRAPILAAILGPDWRVNSATLQILSHNRLKIVSAHTRQIATELKKLLTRCVKPSRCFDMLLNFKLLEELFPELLKTRSLEQSNKSKGMTLYDHIMLTLDCVPIGKNNTVLIRLAGLLHDIGKPHTSVVTETGQHFYNHENVGALLTERILYRWGFSKDISNTVISLVKNHLFDSRKISSTASVKKFIAKIGSKNVHNLLDLRIADRKGSGRKNISMKRVHLLRDRVNKQLSNYAPDNFKLELNDYNITQILAKKYGDLSSETLTSAKNFLKLKVQIGRLENRVSNLKRALHKVAKIECPLGKSHLFDTWSAVMTDSADLNNQNNLSCGIFCNFLCNKKYLSK